MSLREGPTFCRMSVQSVTWLRDGEMDALVRRLLEATTPRPPTALMRRIEWSLRNVASPVRNATGSAREGHRWQRAALAAAVLRSRCWLARSSTLPRGRHSLRSQESVPS